MIARLRRWWVGRHATPVPVAVPVESFSVPERTWKDERAAAFEAYMRAEARRDYW